jgi:hypothetical protein
MPDRTFLPFLEVDEEVNRLLALSTYVVEKRKSEGEYVKEATELFYIHKKCACEPP